MKCSICTQMYNFPIKYTNLWRTAENDDDGEDG